MPTSASHESCNISSVPRDLHERAPIEFVGNALETSQFSPFVSPREAGCEIAENDRKGEERSERSAGRLEPPMAVKRRVSSNRHQPFFQCGHVLTPVQYCSMRISDRDSQNRRILVGGSSNLRTCRQQGGSV